jgi:hypothetical protein
MTEKAAGLFIAPLLILIGLWLCLVEHGKLNGIFWIGSFLVIAGGLWFASDWFVNQRSTKSNQQL